MMVRWRITGVMLGLGLIVSSGCDVQRIILKTAVEQNEPYFHPAGSEGWDKPVKYLFYTHYHKDHAEGGAVLEPEQVLCHEKCARYFSDFDSSKILPPTRTLSGDEEIVLGGVLIRLHYLGKTHTDTLYAVHIPGEKLLFTADFGLVRTSPPSAIRISTGPGRVPSLKYK